MIRETAFDEVFDSQATFRALLDALSRPGLIFRLPARDYPGAPSGFCPPALSVLKTLCDHRVSFSLGSGVRAEEWIRYLEVNLATPHEPVERADYVLFSGRSYDPDFRLMNRGLPEFPEASATALLSVDRLVEEAASFASPSCRLRLRGPGVREHTFLSASGLDPRYADARNEANRLYPVGIDLFLVDREGRVAGIPRTTLVEAA